MAAGLICCPAASGSESILPPLFTRPRTRPGWLDPYAVAHLLFTMTADANPPPRALVPVVLYPYLTPPQPPEGKYRTADLGGNASTSDFTKAIIDKMD